MSAILKRKKRLVGWAYFGRLPDLDEARLSLVTLSSVCTYSPVLCSVQLTGLVPGIVCCFLCNIKPLSCAEHCPGLQSTPPVTGVLISISVNIYYPAPRECMIKVFKTKPDKKHPSALYIRCGDTHFTYRRTNPDQKHSHFPWKKNIKASNPLWNIKAWWTSTSCD